MMFLPVCGRCVNSGRDWRSLCAAPSLWLVTQQCKQWCTDEFVVMELDYSSSETVMIVRVVCLRQKLVEKDDQDRQTANANSGDGSRELSTHTLHVCAACKRTCGGEEVLIYRRTPCPYRAASPSANQRVFVVLGYNRHVEHLEKGLCYAYNRSIAIECYLTECSP